MKEALTLAAFEEAAEQVKKVTLETKLMYSEYFSSMTGNKVYFKPENMQYTGAYKGGVCGEKIRLQGRHRNADHNASDQGQPYEELRSGGYPLWGCL